MLYENKQNHYCCNYEQYLINVLFFFFEPFFDWLRGGHEWMLPYYFLFLLKKIYEISDRIRDKPWRHSRSSSIGRLRSVVITYNQSSRKKKHSVIKMRYILYILFFYFAIPSTFWFKGFVELLIDVNCDTFFIFIFILLFGIFPLSIQIQRLNFFFFLSKMTYLFYFLQDYWHKILFTHLSFY